MNKYLNMSEDEILNSQSHIAYMDLIIRTKQLSEKFLAQTIGYYNSWTCLKHQRNLTPYFCFRYLYCNETDSKCNWTDYNDVIRYLEKQDTRYTQDEIKQAFKQAMNDRHEPDPQNIKN